MSSISKDLDWFVPGRTQNEFINWMGKETVFAGGVGSGKTLAGAFKALMIAHAFPGTVGLVGRQSYRALEDTTKKVMVYGDDKPPVIPDSLVEYKSETENRWLLKCGSEILFRSLEHHNIEKLLSLNLGWVYVDECTEISLRLWLTLMGRLRHPVGPRIIWGSTNPNGHDWIWKRFHPDGGAPVGKIFIQPTSENALHLAPDYMDMLMSMPEQWKKRFVFANFDTAAGMIWDMWDRDVHIYKRDEVGILPPAWKRFESMDHGRRNPTAWLWWVVDPEGNLIVEDEYYVAGKLPTDHAISVSAKRAMISPGIRYGPAMTGADSFRQDHSGKTVAGEYFDAARIVLSPANDNVEAGLLRVAEWMTRSESRTFPKWHPWAGTLGPDGKGSPKLFVSDRAEHLISEIPDYRWDDLSPSSEENRDQPEKPRKKDDHACDALRYGVMSRARPVPLERRHYDKKPSLRRAESVGLIDVRF